MWEPAGPGGDTELDEGPGATRSTISGLLDALVSARTVERPCASFRATWMERSGGVRDQPSSMQAPAAGHQVTIHGALEADLGPEIDSECGDTPLAWWKRSRRVTISHRLEVRASASIHGSWGAASSPLHSMDMLPLRAEAVVQPLCHAWHHHHFAAGGDVLREALGRVCVAQLPVSDLVAPVGPSRPEVEGSASVFLQVQQQADHARGQVMRLSGGPAPKPSGAGESGEGAPASAGAVAEPEPTPRWVAKLSLPPPAPDASVTALNTLLGGKDKQLQRQMHSALHLPAALALVQQGTVSDEAETLSSETIATLAQAAGDLEDVVTAVDDALRQVREALGDSELNDSGSGGLCEAVAELARVVVDSAERKQRLGEVHAACEDARALAWDDVAPIARIASTVPLPGVAGSTGGAGVLRVFKESADTESGVEPLACALLSELDEVLDGVDWMQVLEPVGARRASPASITKGLCQVEVDASPGQGSGAAGLDEVAASLPDVSPLLSATQAAAVSLTAVLDASNAFSALQSGVSEMTTISREQLATLVGAVGDLGKLGIGFLRKVPVMLQLSQHTHSLAEVGLGHAVSRAVVARVADSLLSFILPTSAGFGAIVDDVRGVAGLSGALAGDEVVTKVLTGSPKATDPVLPGVAAAEAQRVKRFKPKAENGEKDTTSDMNTEVEGGDELAKEEEAVAGDDPIAQTLSVVTHLQGLLGVMAPAAKEDLQDVVRPVVTSLGDLATHTHAAHAALGKLWKPVCAACDVARPLCEGPRQGDEAAMERLVHLVEQPHEGVRPLTKCLEKSSEWQEELGAAVKELRPSLTALSRAAAALRPQLQATAQRLPNALSRAMRVLSIVLVHFEWTKSMGDKRTARVGLSASFDIRTEPSNGGSGGGAKGGALISVSEGFAGPSAAEECEGTGEAMQGGPDTLRGGDIRVHPEILALLQTQEGAGLGAEDLPRVRASADFAASASVLSRDVEMLSVHMSPFVDAMGLHNALPQLRVMGIEVTEESLSDPKALLKSAGKALLQKSIEVATSPETLMLVLRKAAELISRTDRSLPLLTWLVRARDVEAAFGKEALERAAAEARPEADGMGPPRVVCNTSSSAAEQSATPDCGISLGGVVMPAAATLLDLYDATAAAGSGEEGSPECASAAHSLQALLRVMGELLTGMGTLVDVAGKGALPPGISLRALLDEAAEKEGHWYARLRTVADESQGGVLDAAGLFSATSGHHLATCVRVILADHIAEAKPIQEVVEAVEVLGGGIGQMASAMEDLVGALGGGDPSEMLALVGSDSPAPWMRNSVGGAKAIARGLRQLVFAADSMEALSPELTEQLRGAAERPVSHLVNAVQGAARSPALRRAAASSGLLLAKVEMGAAVGRAVFGCVFGVATRTTQAVRTLIEQNGDSTQQVATLKDALAEITAMEACKLPSRGPIRDLFEAAQRNSSAAGLNKVERGIVSAMKWINRAQSGLALALRLVERGVVLREIVLQVKGAVEGNGDARAAFKAIDSGIAAVGATISDLRGFLVAMLGLPSHSQLARGLQVVSKAIAFFRSIAATVVTLVRGLLDGEVPLSPAGIADVGVRVLATVAGDKLREAELMQRAIRFPVGMAMLRSSNRLMPLGGLVASFSLPDGRSVTPFTIVEAHHSAFFAPCMVSICYMAGEVNEYEDVAEETGVSEKHKATLASLCRGMQRGQRLLEFAHQGVFAVSETVATDDARDLYGTSPISSGTKVPDREQAGKMRQLEAKVRNLIELEGLDQDIEQVASLPSFAARFQQVDNEVVEYYRDSMRQFLQDSEAFDDTETEDSFVELKTRIRRQRSRNTGAAVGSPTGETADDEIELADEEGSLYVDSNRFRRTNVQPCRPCLQTAVAQLRRAADVFDAYANVATVALPTNEMISKDFEPKILGVTPLEEFPQRSISFLDAVDGMVGAVLDVTDATEFNRTAGVRRLEAVRQGLRPARDSLQEGAMLVRCSQIVARAVDEIVARLATTLHESVVDVSTLVAALRTVVRDARLTFSKLHRGKCWGALQSPSTGLHSAAGMLAQGSRLGSAAADFVSSLGGLIQGVGGVVDALRKVRSPEQGVAVLYRFWKEHYPSLAKALGALEDGAKAVSATGSFRTQGSARVSEVAKEMQRLLLKFDQQVRRIASATAVLSNPRVGLEQLLSEGVVRPGLDLVELVTEEGAIRATLLGLSKEFLRSRDLPVVPALLGSSGGASASMSTNRTTGQALELLELPAEEMAIGGSSLLAIARITAGSAMSVMHNLFCSGKLVLDCTKKLVLDIERRGYEGNDRLDIQDQLVSLFYIKFPAEVFAVYTSIRSIVEQLKELQQVSLEDDGDAYDRAFSALLSRLRQVAQDVERVAENQEKIRSQFSYAMFQLQSTLEDMDDRALQVAAGLAKLPEQMAVKEMMHVVADPIQLAFRLVNEVSGLFHGLTMLLHTPSVTAVNKLSTAMAALGATLVNDVPPQVKTLLDYRSAFSLECPQAAGPGELAAACDFVRKGPALDHFFTSGTARAAVEGLSSEVHELQAVPTRLGAGISAVGMATEGTLGVGLRGIELVSELVYKSQRMTSVRTMLPVLASLSEDGRAIFEDGSGAIVEMWRNFQVAGLLRKEEAERMAESAAPLGQAAAKFRAGVELGLGVLRTALSGASFMETVKASRQEGSSDFARLEILASWEELRAQGTETLACGRRHDLLMELIPASKQGIVETLQSALCTALQKGRSVVEILASVASAEEGEMASVLLATVGQRALEGALSRSTDPDAALKSIVPRIAPTIAGADGSFLTALQNLLALRSTGVLNPSIVGCATSLSQVVGKAVKKAKRELRSPGLQQLDAALQGFEAAASIMVPIAGHHGISKLLAGRGTSSLWKIFVEKLEAPLAAASRHQTTFENLREAASALSPEDMVALTAALAKVQRGGTKADPPSGAEVVSLLRNVSDFAEGTLGAAQLFMDIARSLGSGSGQGVLSTFLGSEASRAAFSGQIPHSELIAAGISESVPAKLLDALEKALPALHALSTSLAGNTTVFGRWAAFAAETSTLCASIQHKPSPATAQATTLVDLADISVHGTRKDDPLHAVFAPLQRRASGLPELHIQGRMGAVVDPSRAFQTVLALQEVVTRSMLMAGEARAALAQPDSATTAEMLEALGETLPQRKDAASQVPLLDSKGLRIAGAVASAVGRQGPHLVASVQRLVSAAKGLSTGEGEDSPNAMFENTVATFEAVAAAPTVASAAMAVAAEAMDLFAAAHAAVNSKNPLAGVRALLDGWDKRVPALLQRLQKARKGLTGTSEKAVQFFERLVTMLGNVFRLVLRAQLKEPETSIVCKGGGAPLPVTLTDDKLMSKGPITLVSLPLGPFPVFGVPLTVTLSLMLRLEAALESGACRFTYMSGREEQYSAVSLPLTAEAMADARVAIGASMGGVGLGLRLSIVGLTLAPQLDVQPASGAACLQLVPIISTLSGEVYLFADLVVTEFRPTLFRWSGLKRRLPGPCKSLKPAVFNTCPAVPMIDPSRGSDSLMQRLFFAGSRPPRIAAPTDVLDPSETAARSTAVLREVNQRGGAAAASQPVMLEQSTPDAPSPLLRRRRQLNRAAAAPHGPGGPGISTTRPQCTEMVCMQ